MNILRVIRLKSILRILIAVLLLSVDANALFTNSSLPKVTGVKKVVDRSGIGFEWSSLSKYPNIQGVKIYRAEVIKGKRGAFQRIGAVGSRFATHFVDTTVKAGMNYIYTFTTFSGLSESPYGEVVAVRSKPPYKAVKFVSATLVDRGVVKLLWVPNSEPTVTEYVIQRNCSYDNKWHFLGRVKGRISPEYIDTNAMRGYKCSYRVFATDPFGTPSFLGKVLSVEVK